MSHSSLNRLPAALVALLVASLAPTAFATHEDGASLEVRQEPHEGDDCHALVVEVMGVDNATIRLGIFQHGEGSAPDTELVYETPMGTLDEETGLYDYVLGPYGDDALDNRTTDLYVGVAWGEPGEHRILTDHFDRTCDDDEPPLPCPAPVDAEANGDGSIVLTWDHVQMAEGYRVHRSDDDGATFALVGTVEHPGNGFLDEDTEGGVTYQYRVTAFVGETESSGCEVVEVTAIPFFGGPVLVALAGVGGIAAYATLRRRS